MPRFNRKMDENALINNFEGLKAMARQRSTAAFIKACKRKGGILDYMRKEIKMANSCYIY